MKITLLAYWSILFLLCGITPKIHAQRGPITYVNTMIGTAPATTASAQKHSEAGSELKGQTMPAVSTPYAMTQWTAQTRATETKCVAPYYYDDKAIQGFRGTHWLNGSCVQEYGSATIMAISGDLKPQPQQRASRYQHSREISTPALYQVQLEDYQIKAEMTSTPRCGMLRFSFENTDEHFILLEPNSDEGQGYVEIFPEKGEIVGYNPVHRIYQGAGQSAGFSGYFVVQFDKPFTQHGTWRNAVTNPLAQAAKGEKRGESMGAYVSFGKTAQVVTVRVGTSFTSLEGARQNLQAEIVDFDFETIKKINEAIWNEALGKMAVKGKEEDKVLFYSTLYRTKLTPRLLLRRRRKLPYLCGRRPPQVPPSKKPRASTTTTISACGIPSARLCRCMGCWNPRKRAI